jgi:succinate dehydrogenase / fumarate reductase, membrane anchor subunit
MSMAQREITSGTATPQVVKVRPGSGTWPWILQRLSAYGLIIFLGIHMWFNHFARLDATDTITFELVNMRFKVYPFIYALNDSLLLATTIFHGFNGVRNVVYDLTVSEFLRRAATAVLVVLGAVLFVLGALALWALMDIAV